MVSSGENYEHHLYEHCEAKDADAIAWAFTNKDTFKQFPYKHPELQADELRTNVLFAGLCLSDSLHARSRWGPSMYPIAPGHEIIAEVAEVGADVKDFQKGDKVAFGTLRETCGSCKMCNLGRETLCTEAYDKFTYGIHWGGYSTSLQQPASFYFKLPDNLDLKRAAPLLCAGVTVYSPMKKYLRKDDVTAVVGIGGLGHLAVQFLAKLGHKVVAFTTSLDKKDLIMNLGASEVVSTKDEKELKKHTGKYDFVINTTPVGGELFPKIVALCAPASHLVQVGVPDEGTELNVPVSLLVTQEINLVGSLVGTRSDTVEMLQLCADKDIYPMVEEFSFEKFDEALDKLENGKPKFRCTVDVASFSKKNNLFK